MKPRRAFEENGLCPDCLLDSMGYSPADNREGYGTTVHWRSKLAGGQVRTLFQWERLLDLLDDPALYGPAAFWAAWQKGFVRPFLTDPVRVEARRAARTGAHPDIFARENETVEEEYARLLRDFCGRFMPDGAFDRNKAREVRNTDGGRRYLMGTVREFAALEYRYHSLGLTRLKAMKELLQCLLMLVTEQPLRKRELPFTKRGPDGEPALDFGEYLEEIRVRLENLYREDAFDIKGFSERATGGRIGYTPYDIVEGSRIHGATLRRYPLPQGVEPNGRVLYMVTPLINRPEIFDLAEGKSVVQGMAARGYLVYLVDHGEPGAEEADLGLDFYGKELHDHYLDSIMARHPSQDVEVMAYCMGGTLVLPYLARRAEELRRQGKPMDVSGVVLMASPFRFDDGESGHGPMRRVIRESYDPLVMEELFGPVNVPPQVIDMGMQEIQPGVQYTVASGFYGRASRPDAIADSAPFLFWLLHGTRFPSAAHRQWIRELFMENRIMEGRYRLPSFDPALHDRPADMDALREACVAIFNYRGERDPISPPGSCVAGELWGVTRDSVCDLLRGGLNRTIERNVGHIFVVSKKLLAEYLESVQAFFDARV